jgi:hypothetical protein
VKTLLLALALISLHNVDGMEILVNPEEIATMRPSTEAQGGSRNTLTAPGIKCHIGLANGHHFGVVESCNMIRDLIQRLRQ